MGFSMFLMFDVLPVMFVLSLLLHTGLHTGQDVLPGPVDSSSFPVVSKSSDFCPVSGLFFFLLDPQARMILETPTVIVTSCS